MVLTVTTRCFHSGSKTPLQSFLGIAEQHTAHNGVRVSLAITPLEISLLLYVNVQPQSFSDTRVTVF